MIGHDAPMFHADSIRISGTFPTFITRYPLYLLPSLSLYLDPFPPLPPPPLHPLLPLHTSKPCLAYRRSPGPTILTLHRSPTDYTFQKRKILLASFSARYPMVRPQMHSHSCAYFVCSVDHSRGRYRSVLPMYRLVAQPRKPHEGGHQVGSRGSHCGHVRLCNNSHRDKPRPSIRLLRRQ